MPHTRASRTRAFKRNHRYGKDDLALEVLKKLLRKNKSSYKAWDLIGQIREKGLEYTTAALVYENAWSFCDGADPAIGYVVIVCRLWGVLM